MRNMPLVTESIQVVATESGVSGYDDGKLRSGPRLCNGQMGNGRPDRSQ
jgi:hypothetical protein